MLVRSAKNKEAEVKIMASDRICRRQGASLAAAAVPPAGATGAAAVLNT